MLDEKRRGGFAISPRHGGQFQFARRVPVKGCRKIRKRSAGILNDQTGDTRIFLFALGNNHRCPFVDGVTDELMAVSFLTPQRHEHGVPLHSPRVIRDVFHRAIN